MKQREIRNAVALAVNRRLATVSAVAGLVRGARNKSLRRAGARIRLICLIDLVQDVDLVLPVAVAARDSGRFDVSICQTAWLRKVSPRAGALIADAGFEPLVVSRKAILLGMQPKLDHIDALLMASESTSAPHLFSHTLARRAKREGVRTFVMQHGLENLGLTYREEGRDVEFASDHILTWGPPELLPAWVPEQRRTRCIGVGIAKPAASNAPPLLPLVHEKRLIVGVFENLHWDRYSPRYRAAFLRDLTATAMAYPDKLFVVKPHHAGQWLSKNRAALAGAENILLADPADPAWERFTAGAIIERATAVITTPSTVALDAARLRCPAAVAGYDLDLPAYAPLQVLRGAGDWSTFLAQKVGDHRAGRLDNLDEFRRRHVVMGDARAAILTAIEDQLRGGPFSPTDYIARGLGLPANGRRQ